MTILTFLVFDSDNSILLFQGGSIGSTMKVFRPNFLLILVLYIVTILSTILFRKRLNVLSMSFLIFFSLWFLSGRTIGVQWTGELTTGWFYLSTSKIILSKNSDCAENVIECITVEDSYMFRLKIISETEEKDIFVGPVIRTDLKNYFNQKDPKDI